MATLPHLLSLFRLASMPALLVLAWTGRDYGFVALLAAMLLSDVLDGWLARHLGVESELGARLDSCGDLATWLSLPICVWWLWPELVIDQAVFVVLIAQAYLLPIAAGLTKFHRLTSYHTRGAKASAVAMGAAFVPLVGYGEPLPFQLATALFCVSAFEELAITATLPHWRADVPTLLHARRLARAA